MPGQLNTRTEIHSLLGPFACTSLYPSNTACVMICVFDQRAGTTCVGGCFNLRGCACHCDSELLRWPSQTRGLRRTPFGGNHRALSDHHSPVESSQVVGCGDVPLSLAIPPAGSTTFEVYETESPKRVWYRRLTSLFRLPPPVISLLDC